MIRHLEKAAILVDWNNAVNIIGKSEARVGLKRVIRDTISRIQLCSARVLSSIDGTSRFACSLRIYYGWHSLREPTDLRKKFDDLIADPQFTSSVSRTIGRVSFLPEIYYGDHIFSDEKYGTLYNTKRAQGQKMVDTAIACDTLTLLFTGYARKIVIISDDDDFIPSLVSAEALGFRVFLVRRPGHTLRDVCDDEGYEGIRYWE
jgi:uncharacterized LabA/DUF88 family protein